jgi:ubiquinone/menaquinone biosynthesis C-methylase UbiE
MNTTIDAGALKEIQKFIWSQGDFRRITADVTPAAAGLVEAVGTRAGDRVLDVAAGTGGAALAAAQLGAIVTASDLTPRMVEHGRARTAVAGLSVEWLEADAEALPFADAAFDRVVSCFGAIFAPRPAAVASELLRVTRPGGTVGLANWEPDSFPGRSHAAVASFMPPVPDGIPAFTDWGIEACVRDRLASLVSGLRITRRIVVMEHPSVDAMLAHVSENLGPVVAARIALGDRFAELSAQLGEVIAGMNVATDGSVRIESGYLEVVGSA